MSGHNGDQDALGGDRPKRTTMKGRAYGRVSYAAEIPEREDDLRQSLPMRLSGASEPADEELTARTTGQRRRAS